MTTRTKIKQKSNLVQLPLMANVALYTRVATCQELPQDGQTQEERLTQFVTQFGYTIEQVTMFSDEGAAAAKPQAERPGYTKLLQAVSKGEVSVILVSDVSRLFTDAAATQLQVSTFMLLCMEKGVIVATPQTVYDFTNLSLVSQFRANIMKAFQMLEEAQKLLQKS